MRSRLFRVRGPVEGTCLGPSSAFPCRLQRFAQHFQIPNVVGQQQDQAGVERFALFVAQAVVGLDQVFIGLETG